MQRWPHPRVEAAGADATARVCTGAVLGTSQRLIKDHNNDGSQQEEEILTQS